MILVTVRENEPFEKALRRFRRKVEREGIRKDIKKNSFYLKPGEKRRLKQRLACLLLGRGVDGERDVRAGEMAHPIYFFSTR